MMMPANFSAVNAEVVYGGAVADYLPNAWTAANVKQFSTNVIKLFGSDGTLKTWLYGADAGDMSFLNKTMRTLGLASFVYTLGTASAKVGFEKDPANFPVTIKKI